MTRQQFMHQLFLWGKLKATLAASYCPITAVYWMVKKEYRAIEQWEQAAKELELDPGLARKIQNVHEHPPSDDAPADEKALYREIEFVLKER